MTELHPIAASTLALIDLAIVYDVHSAKGNGIDRRELYEHISRILTAEQLEAAYGIVLTALFVNGTKQEVLVLGFPDPKRIDIRSLKTVGGLPYLIRKDAVVSAIGSADWKHEPVQFHEKAGLKCLSLGLVDNVREGGSFGGFLTGSEQGKVFGLTAAHCLPQASVGSLVCSPSALEVSGRFERLRRYTKYAVPGDKLHCVLNKENEAADILRMIGENPDDLTRDAGCILSGSPLGAVECIRLEYKAGILAEYDQALRSAGKATHGATPDMVTSLDYAIMRTLNSR